MAFKEQRIPVDVAPGVSVAPAFMTTIKQLRGGGEHRNALWSTPLRTYRAQYNARTQVRIEDELYSFLMDMRGSLHGFRVRDWSDYRVTDELIAIGDGGTFWFRLIKRYGSYSRRIFKPDSETVVIKVNGVTIPDTSYVVDGVNGTVIFSFPPLNGEVIRWSGQFDVPCRFEDDAFDVVMSTDAIGGVSSVSLREIRVRENIDFAYYDYLRELIFFNYNQIFDILREHVNIKWRDTQ